MIRYSNLPANGKAAEGVYSLPIWVSLPSFGLNKSKGRVETQNENQKKCFPFFRDSSPFLHVLLLLYCCSLPHSSSVTIQPHRHARYSTESAERSPRARGANVQPRSRQMYSLLAARDKCTASRLIRLFTHPPTRVKRNCLYSLATRTHASHPPI